MRTGLKVVLLTLGLVLVLIATLHARPGARPRRVLAPCSVVRTDGRRLAVAAGQPTVLVFWSTHCTPCLQQIPALAALARRLPHPHRTLIAVAIAQDDAQTVAAFAPPLPYAVTRDLGGTLAATLDIRRIPELVVVGAHGRVRLRRAGTFAPGAVLHALRARRAQPLIH
ncbi:MAG TPA: TlpA disulfide reductase family protein [Acidiferrobacteraceae bacterium]|nr:TlpA disulfide reductase family protein [Acidiferrobacteraceae bacterium]